MVFEAIEVCRPELAVGREPIIELFERLRPDAIQATLCICARHDEPCVLEDAEMFGHGRLAEAEAVDEFTDRPHRLMMTWTFDDDPSNEQLIELSFSESEGSTTVLMVNSGISTDERRDAQDEGWHGCLDELARVLAG